MRFLIICLLFSLSLSGQADMNYDAKYVWAKSGLTMRAEGHASAPKIGVIPFGSKVIPTYRNGRPTKVVALPAVSYDWVGEKLTSDAYVMNHSYIEVVSGQDTGFVYDGYLSYFPCIAPGADPAKDVTLDEWLTWLGGTPDTVSFARRRAEYGRPYTVLHYKNGLVTTSREMEGGGSYLMAFPLGSINEGFLIAERFLVAADGVVNKDEILESGDVEPELLTIEEDGTLYFGGGMGETRIYVVEGMLFIYTAGWC